MLNPATFNRKVSFCVPTTTKSAMGAASKVYVASFYMWLSREAATPVQEQYVNSRLVLPNRYLYKGHYDVDVKETLQMVDDGEKFNILSVNHIENKMFIEIVAEKITE